MLPQATSLSPLKYIAFRIFNNKQVICELRSFGRSVSNKQQVFCRRQVFSRRLSFPNQHVQIAEVLVHFARVRVSVARKPANELCAPTNQLLEPSSLHPHLLLDRVQI